MGWVDDLYEWERLGQTPQAVPVYCKYVLVIKTSTIERRSNDTLYIAAKQDTRYYELARWVDKI